MNILFDARTASPRFPGIGRYATELAPALAEILSTTGDTLTLIAHPTMIETLSPAPNITPIPCDVAPDSPKSTDAIHAIIDAVRPAVYHTPHRMCHPPSTVATVLTIHDCIPIKCAFETTPQQRIVFLGSVGHALRACTRAICVSQTTLDDLDVLFPAETGKCRVVHHGVNERFCPLPPNPHIPDADVPHDPRPVILYVGSNLRHKNLVGLFRGFAHARSLLQDVRLVLAGHGCQPLARHTRTIQSLNIQDSVSWMGEIAESDLPALIRSATACVMPSLYEGFGLPALEALACGTPVACSDIAATREVCGDAACYFDPENPDSIAQAIVSAVSDDIIRSRNHDQGLLRAQAFSWRQAALKTRDVYREAVAAHTPAPSDRP